MERYMFLSSNTLFFIFYNKDFIMKRNFRILVFLILTVLLSSRIVYSQVNFWEPTNFPYGFSGFNSITIADNGDIWVVTYQWNSDGSTTPGIILLSTDNGDTWVKKDTLKSFIYAFGINSVTGSIFACGSGLHRSTDSGESWTNLNDNNLDPLHYFTNILITSSGEIYVIGRSEKRTSEGDILYSYDISYSNDDGNTWIRKNNNGLPPYIVIDSVTYRRIIITSVALGTDGTLYAGTNCGIYHSTNGGDDWLLSSNYNGQVCYDLAVSSDGSIFATASTNGIFKSTDNGVTWNQVGDMYGSLNKVGTSYISIDKIVCNPITNHLFVSGGGLGPGLYRSDDLGETWHEMLNNIHLHCLLRDFAVNPTTEIVFVGLIVHTNNGREIFTVYRSIEQTMPLEKPEYIPTTYSLSQNYPNPFNPTTIIQYSIPKDEFVKLTVYDITGKVVKELVSGHKAAGRYSVEFNASSYSSGTYYYKIEAGEYKNIQKMMLIK